MFNPNIIVEPASRLYIPALGIDAPVVQPANEQEAQDAMINAVVQQPHGANPFVSTFTGHSSGNSEMTKIFAGINKLKPGTTIGVMTGNGLRAYHIGAVFIFRPEVWPSIVFQSYPTICLMTCYPTHEQEYNFIPAISGLTAVAMAYLRDEHYESYLKGFEENYTYPMNTVYEPNALPVATGGQLDLSQYTLVGDKPGGQLTEYSELITPGGQIIPADETRMLIRSGAINFQSAAVGRPGGGIGVPGDTLTPGNWMNNTLPSGTFGGAHPGRQGDAFGANPNRQSDTPGAAIQNSISAAITPIAEQTQQVMGQNEVAARIQSTAAEKQTMATITGNEAIASKLDSILVTLQRQGNQTESAFINALRLNT